MFESRFNFFKQFRRFFSWLWEQDGTPAQRARGIAVGVFCGCFPLFGLQTLLGIMLASLFRGNRLLAATGTWFSNPLTYLPLYWFNYKVGSAFLGERQTLQNYEHLTKQELWNEGWVFSSRILLGSTLVGIVFGVLTGLVLYVVLKKLSKERNSFNKSKFL